MRLNCKIAVLICTVVLGACGVLDKFGSKEPSCQIGPTSKMSDAGLNSGVRGLSAFECAAKKKTDKVCCNEAGGSYEYDTFLNTYSCSGTADTFKGKPPYTDCLRKSNTDYDLCTSQDTQKEETPKPADKDKSSSSPTTSTPSASTGDCWNPSENGNVNVGENNTSNPATNIPKSNVPVEDVDCIINGKKLTPKECADYFVGK